MTVQTKRVKHYGRYPPQLNHQLHPQPSTPYRVLDLFAGCGGLSLGFEAAGLHSVGYEMDERAALLP